MSVWNRLTFVALAMLERQMLSSLLHAIQANALRHLKSFSESIMYDPRYLKSLTLSIFAPEIVLIGGGYVL